MTRISDAANERNGRRGARATTATGPVGVLAGGGGLPMAVAQAIKAQGRDVHVVAIRGEAGPAIERFKHDWVYWGGVGAMLRAFRDAGCAELVIAGSVRRPDIRRIRPDLGFVKALPSVLALFKGGDDSVLSNVVRFFEAERFVVRGASDFVPHLLAGRGPQGSMQPDADRLAAIDVAVGFLKALGPFDVGQAAVVGRHGIIAVEGARGTDAMLGAIVARMAGQAEDGGHGEAHSSRGAVLVKLPKPGQEMRVDMPAIGPQTIERAALAGLAGVAVAAGRTLLLEREDLLRRAEAAGLFLIGLDEGQLAPAGSGSEPARRDTVTGGAGLAALGRARPSVGDKADIDLGCALLAVSARHGAGRAAVIARRHVLAVQGAEPVADMIAMAASGRPWGRLARRRRGILILSALGPSGRCANLPGGAANTNSGGLIRAASDAGLAGIACLDPSDGAADLRNAIPAADAAGLFWVGPKQDQ